MLRILLSVVVIGFALVDSEAQFTLQHSGTDASLRGIANVDGSIAWASGGYGTVLRTVDGGAHWTRCATPPGAKDLDFRGVQAFDGQTALVMSSGKGEGSRVYKTVNGGAAWKLVFANPDAPDGFFDAIQFARPEEGWILGDAVKGHFFLAATQDGGETWMQSKADGLATGSGGGAFAASNQSLLLQSSGPVFGSDGGRLFRGLWPQCSQSTSYNDPGQCLDRIWFQSARLPVGGEVSTAGIFALAGHGETVIAVGGDFANPDDAAHVAAFSTDGGLTWQPSGTEPSGYRSSLAFDEKSRIWITVGPNGTDVSTDEGRSWMRLRPDVALGDTADADRSWNALSLPFAVGLNGRIGKLRVGATDSIARAPR